MKITVYSKKLEKKLHRLANADIGREIVKNLTARGMNISMPLAQADPRDLSIASSIIPYAITYKGGNATGGFGTNHELSAFVEFGTGLPGQSGKVANGEERNPVANSFNYTLETTIKSGPQKGFKRKGWVYFDETQERFVHTLGQPAYPFMYPAQKKLIEETPKEARAVIRDNIRRD